jgi:hypothetical protein
MGSSLFSLRDLVELGIALDCLAGARFRPDVV